MTRVGITTDETAGRPRHRRVDSSGPFWKYWTASATSSIGDGITAIALPLLALADLDASNFEVALITAAKYAATLLVGLPAGVIVQRFALRRLQVSLDMFRAVAVLTIPLAAWWDVLTLPHLLVVAFVVGLASNLFDVANVTYIPKVVPPEHLTARNGLLGSTAAVTQLGGPALGGLLVQIIGAAYSVLVDAVTYLVSAVILHRIPEAGRPERTTESAGLLQRVKVGLRYVLRHPVMRPCVVAATSVNFANGALLAVTPPFLVRSLGLAEGAVGLVIAADGVGSLLGAAVTARMVRRYGSARTLLLATVGGALLAVLMPLAGTRWAVGVFAVGMAGLAAGVAILSIVARTHRQTVSPPDMLSRVMASVRFISWGATPVGALLAGAGAQMSGPRAGLAVVVVAAAIAPVALWFSRVRSLTELTDAEEARA